MNKTDVVEAVAQKTGVDKQVCEAVVNAFEEQSGDQLANKFRGIKPDSGELLAGVSARSGASQEDCERILTALDQVLDAGLADKLRFWKRRK